jgi:hypothetical protein
MGLRDLARERGWLFVVAGLAAAAAAFVGLVQFGAWLATEILGLSPRGGVLLTTALIVAVVVGLDGRRR